MGTRNANELRAVTGGTHQPDAETVARFVSAWLDTTPGDERPSLHDALQAFAELVSRWRDADVDVDRAQAALLEGATEIASRYGLAVGELLSDVSRLVATSGRRNDLKQVATDRRILDAAYDVFADKGFYNATVDEIAQEAGVGKGTVYRHFDSKDNLFQAVVREKLLDLVAQVREGFETADDVLQGIRRAVSAYLRFFEKHNRFYRILVFEQQGFGTEFRTEYIAGILQNVPQIRDMVISAAEEGITKPLDDFYTIFYGIVGFMDGVIHKWFYNNCEGSLEDEIDTIIEVLFYGFVARKGNGGT